MRKACLQVVFLVLVLAVSFLATLPVTVHNVFGNPSPSTVDTDLNYLAVGNSFQRRTFYYAGRFWVFYANGTAGLSIVWKSSTDGVSWSSQTYTGQNVLAGEDFGVAFNNTLVHLVAGAQETPKFRVGTPNSDGSVSWVAAWQNLPTDATAYHNRPTMAVDTGGYAWVAYENASDNQVWMQKNSLNNGLWTTASGYPKKIPTTASDSSSSVHIVPLTNQWVYIIWQHSVGVNIKARGRLYNGTWQNDEAVSTSNIYDRSLSAVNEGDDVHVAITTLANNLVYLKRTYATQSWSGEGTIQASVSSSVNPTLSLDVDTGNVYCFWIGSPTANRVYYKLRSGGSWGDLVDWDGDVDIFRVETILSFRHSSSQKIGVLWLNRTQVSPDRNTLRFDYLTTTAPEYDYVDVQSNVDGVADKGTHSDFNKQKATDSDYDTLTEADSQPKSGESTDYVDNNDSNVDGSADKGTHGNFTAQQYKDSFYDTLTEANTGAGSGTDTLYVDGFSDTYVDWTEVGSSPYLSNSDANYIYIATLNALEGNWTFADTSSVGTINYVRIYFEVYQTGTLETVAISLYDGISWTTNGWTLLELPSSYGWLYVDVSTKLNSWVKINAAKMTVKYLKAGAAGTVYIRRAYTYVSWTDNNYELDLEVQWTAADPSQTVELLCINMGTTDAEDIKVDVWTGSWTNIAADLTASSWNNISVTSYLTAATFTIRFKGGTEASDTTQSSWQIEVTLLWVYTTSTNYELEIEEQFTGANFTRTNRELCIKTGTFNAGGETLSVQWWNSTSSAWVTIIASLSANSWNNISVTTYLTSATFTIRFLDGTKSSDASQGTWQKDATLLHTWDVVGVDFWIDDLRLSTTSDETNISSIYVWTYYDWEVNITYSETMAQLENVTIRIENNPTTPIQSATPNFTENNEYWFRYDNDTDTWRWYDGTTWSSTTTYLDISSCTKPSGSATNGWFKFVARLSKIASASTSWEFSAIAWNTTGYVTKTFNSITINNYLEITVITTSHTWSNATTGTNDNLIDQGSIVLNVTSNIVFNLQAQGNASYLVSPESYQIGIGNITIHKDTLGSSIPLATTWANIVGLTSLPAGKDQQYSFKLWLDVPSDSQPWTTYQYKCEVKVVAS